MKLALSLLLVGSMVDQSGAQRNQPTLYDFSTLKTFRCDFTESEGRRTTAAGVTTPAKRETFSDLVIDAVDSQRRTARFIGNAGSETVQVFDGEMTISFLEADANRERERSVYFQTYGLTRFLPSGVFKALGSDDRRPHHLTVVRDVPRALVKNFRRSRLAPG